MVRYFFTAAALLLVANSALAAKTVTINKKQISVESKSLSAEESLRLKKIFLFPTVDDVSGVLSPKLDEKMVQVFRANTRFDLIRDPAVIKALSPDEAAYAKVAQDKTVHKEAAKVTGADTTALLRTRNIGTVTEMTLEFRDADGELLYLETGSVPGYSSMDARWALIDKLFEAVIKKIPFEGSVSGRTANTLTVDLGFKSVKQGEDIEVARIVSLQRHPLLKTIVGLDYVRVGRAKIGTVDKVLSFAEVAEEFPGEFISAGNKVLAVKKVTHSEEPPIEKPAKNSETRSEKKDDQPKFEEERILGDFDRPKARYGYAAANLAYGSVSHTQTVSGVSSELSGSGLGVGLEGELWITRHWIAKGSYSAQSASMTGSGLGPLDASVKRAEFFAGYRFFPSGINEGLDITGALGYQLMDFSIPTVSASAIGGRRYAGIAFRADVNLQFQEKQKIYMGLSFQPFSSVTETVSTLGTASSATVVGFGLGWAYALSETIWARVGLQFDSANSSYPSSSTSSDKKFAIGPGLQYSF